ncbi:MAG: RNA 2',3'-cyclic phosphodiesterase [Anaerolineales bacterium]|nr:RNA 2',3'-cyclic phosphodiesterase [Anaerolineales bacterium]
MPFIRAFIAISLTDEIYQHLDQVISLLQSRLPKAPVRWAPANNIHLTLKFLGEISTANLAVLQKTLQAEVSRHAPFEISVGEVGAFPSIRRPRVIWVGVKAPPELHTVQHNVEAELARLGYAAEERDFSPHLTLGRIGRNATPEEVHKISEVLSSVRVGFLGAARVQTVHLYRSDLQPGGALYTRLFTAHLAASEGQVSGGN